MTQVITGKQIPTFRLMQMKMAVKLEARGMQMTRGPKITPVARKEMGLGARAPHADVIAALEAEITKQLAEQQKDAQLHADADAFVKQVTSQE